MVLDFLIKGATPGATMCDRRIIWGVIPLKCALKFLFHEYLKK
jgi:hypothetical protein